MSRSAPVPWPARIEGGSAADRAVGLAGLLAERGVQSLVIRRGEQVERLRARVTDLPAALAAAGPCVVEPDDPEADCGLRYRVTLDSITRESA